MAKIKPEEIVYDLRSEFRKALEDTFKEFAPDVHIDSSEVVRFFEKKVYSRCSSWESVRDDHVKKDCPNCRKEI